MSHDPALSILGEKKKPQSAETIMTSDGLTTSRQKAKRLQ